ncbi:beta-N-acetylglucosaminidase domain-containing protein [Phenylobacterium sp.]|uniref:beta-N-acetylglucosaminidase domain-containing protein n=1 Tax=Phenylobacterium sp. TaxID=1871053 RepID=UPI00271661E9|nr:beta-N-acetylglucosaminidase domain-containing protein [Phenylobacterium sp.]MDO8378819.1 beta-N-acetylglucosaminidase domain-containing protein [Phenylobacterium sp.]
MTVELGIIEGYYGAPWSWAERRDQVSFLAPHGYGFYMYAPKADPWLRRRWQEQHPAEMAAELLALSDHCAEHGVRFGVGLSPFELYRDFDGAAQEALAGKLAMLDMIGIQDLGVLFDDMRGDLPELAATQVRIIHWIAERTAATRVIACPTYYSDAPELDRAFGSRPESYLEDFGSGLDPAIEVFWTGEEVCSKEFTPGHLARVAGQLRRKPFLWDNYPVNDGPRMSPHLHLRAFTGRPGSIADHVAAHAVNPALQPVLSRIPALTLADSYRLGEDYQYGKAFLAAARTVLGDDLAYRVQGHLVLLQDTGLDRLGDAIPTLRARYAAYDHPGAREILAWLDGAYVITQQMMAAEH